MVLESCPEHKDYNDDLRAELAADNQPLIDLPEKAQDNRRVFAHLAKDAAVNSDLINRYMTQGLLYQSEQTVERDGQVKKYASAVFLGRDPDGNPDSRHACVSVPVAGERLFQNGIQRPRSRRLYLRSGRKQQPACF